jgi:hypothetical protein
MGVWKPQLAAYIAHESHRASELASINTRGEQIAAQLAVSAATISMILAVEDFLS